MTQTTQTSLEPVFRFEFDGRPVVAVNFRGRWCWIAAQISSAIGYQQPRRLASKVSGTWADEFIEGQDYAVLSGSDLNDLRHLLDVVPESGTTYLGAKVPKVTVLYESGLHLALQKTHLPAGKKLRRILAEKVLPQLVRDGRYDPGRTVNTDGQLVVDSVEGEREDRLLTLREAELAIREAELAHRVRQTEAGALWRLRNILGEGGRVGDDVLESLAVTAAEIESGRMLAGYKPPADDSLHWASPTEIAERLNVSAQKVGRAITQLGLRGKEGMSRGIANKASHSDRTVVSYLYSPEAVEQIESQVTGSE